MSNKNIYDEIYQKEFDRKDRITKEIDVDKENMKRLIIKELEEHTYNDNLEFYNHFKYAFGRAMDRTKENYMWNVDFQFHVMEEYLKNNKPSKL